MGYYLGARRFGSSQRSGFTRAWAQKPHKRDLHDITVLEELVLVAPLLASAVARLVGGWTDGHSEIQPKLPVPPPETLPHSEDILAR